MNIKSPWNRAAIVASSLWVMVGSGIYVSALGEYFGDFPSVWEKFPFVLQWWVAVCANLSLEIYSISRDFHWRVGFDPVGYIVFIGGPLEVLLTCILGAKWVAEGVGSG